MIIYEQAYYEFKNLMLLSSTFKMNSIWTSFITKMESFISTKKFNK